jgi:hypothetical protein
MGGRQTELQATLHRLDALRLTLQEVRVTAAGPTSVLQQ